MYVGKSRLASLRAFWPAPPSLVLALAQLLLPRIAASRICSRVGRYGQFDSVSVSAWPAVELLWGSADSVQVQAGSLALNPAQAPGCCGKPRAWRAWT